MILGGGMSGLAAGIVSGRPVYEAAPDPGGICGSYYMRPGDGVRLSEPPRDGDAFRFERGGGHWIFGGSGAVLDFLEHLGPFRRYTRSSGVFFPAERQYVPYPLQDHLRQLPEDTRVRALAEMAEPAGRVRTMADWLEQSFGSTLYRLFFEPFHALYTAGLHTVIAPQDGYKSPTGLRRAIQGAIADAPSVGYNVTYLYPEHGLDSLARRMAEDCRIHYGKRATRVDLKRKEVEFDDGTDAGYDTLVSTLPLNRMMELTGLAVDARPDPFTSVLVLNIGAERGPRCPDYHWLYVPASRAGFHRVGFYSNVDPSFLPASRRVRRDVVSIYVERSFAGLAAPDTAATEAYTREVIDELQAWEFIGAPMAVDSTWIDVAYTWSWPGSTWAPQAIACLRDHGVFQVGRFAEWRFQGIADSIRDGFSVGACFRQAGRRGDR